MKGKIIAFFWSNIGLFNLIYKPIVFNAKQTKSPKQATSVFLRIWNVLFLLLKMLIRNVVYMFKL